MITQIVCAVDDTESSSTAADFAISLASQMSAGLVFCMVNQATLSPWRGVSRYLWTDDYIRDHLDEALRRARLAGLQQVACEAYRATTVAYAIVTCAELYAADLIVVGASRPRRIIDFFRRTISRAVADTASCPVLIVRHARARFPRHGCTPKTGTSPVQLSDRPSRPEST